MSGDGDRRDDVALAAVPGCPSADALAAFAAGKLSEEELVTIADHVSHCETCESAVRGASGQEDSLALRLRAAVLHPAPLEEPACLRMQAAAQAIRPPRDESTAETEIDAGGGESRSAAGPPAAATVTWAPNLPATIGRYHVRSVLGRGGFGTVYLAHDPELDRSVAIKVPRFDPADAEQRIEWFLQEARTAARLKHPGIVAVYEAGRQSDGSCYIVMEYVEGQSLAAEMAQGKLPLPRAVQIVREAADALHYAHKKGFVHRDLKPGNILLDAEGHVKIVDFGLAVHEDQQRSRRGELAGTLAYMSPEQLRGQVHRLDGRSDIWSLGVILYELLAGRKPFAGTRLEMADEIQHRSPKPPRQIDDTIPAELERICLKCLAKDADQRYTSAGDVAAEIARYQTPEPWPLLPRSRPVRYAVAAALLTVCAAAIYAAVNWWRDYEVPFQVDRVAIPFEPMDLLARRPENMFGQTDSSENSEHHPRARTVRMESTSTALLGLGMTSSGWFRVQGRMSKSAPIGYAGIFIGLKQVSAANGESQWECQVISVNRRPGAPPFLERELLFLAAGPSPGFSVRRRTSVANVQLQRASLERSSLEVTVKNGQIVEVRLDGSKFPQLTDAKSLSRWRIPSCDGRFGLMNSFGGTTFSDFTFESLRSKDL